jgi:thiamine pyrophosphate-dependent acetolactate synthase large subunit-like protein
MGELSAAVFHKRDVKVLFLNNDAFGEVKFEQRDIGNPEWNELHRTG